MVTMLLLFHPATLAHKQLVHYHETSIPHEANSTGHLRPESSSQLPIFRPPGLPPREDPPIFGASINHNNDSTNTGIIGHFGDATSLSSENQTPYPQPVWPYNFLPQHDASTQEAAVAASVTEKLQAAIDTSTIFAGVPASTTELSPSGKVASEQPVTDDDKNGSQHVAAAVATAAAAAACPGASSSHQGATAMPVTPFSTYPNALRLGPANRSAPDQSPPLGTTAGIEQHSNDSFIIAPNNFRSHERYNPRHVAPPSAFATCCSSSEPASSSRSKSYETITPTRSRSPSMPPLAEAPPPRKSTQASPAANHNNAGSSRVGGSGGARHDDCSSGHASAVRDTGAETPSGAARNGPQLPPTQPNAMLNQMEQMMQRMEAAALRAEQAAERASAAGSVQSRENAENRNQTNLHCLAHSLLQTWMLTQSSRQELDRRRRRKLHQMSLALGHDLNHHNHRETTLQAKTEM